MLSKIDVPLKTIIAPKSCKPLIVSLTLCFADWKYLQSFLAMSSAFEQSPSVLKPTGSALFNYHWLELFEV